MTLRASPAKHVTFLGQRSRDTYQEGRTGGEQTWKLRDSFQLSTSIEIITCSTKTRRNSQDVTERPTASAMTNIVDREMARGWRAGFAPWPIPIDIRER